MKPAGIAVQAVLLFALLLGRLAVPARAQSILFDFDNAPVQTPLPLDLAAGGITAHFAGTGQSYSIQHADVLGFLPVGFSGLCIYPNSVFAADLLIGFSRPVQEFSILYAPEEYGCDDSATMRVTGLLGSEFAATNTAIAPTPGTWPTGLLSLAAPLGFDSVVVHYDTPPLCGDRGPIFMADNMTVTPLLQPVFLDGFESGDASGWSIVVS